MAADDGTGRWIEAGLAELAHGGIDRVRVEVVAERLGVTKGGFYRRFKDRRALLDAILETWRRGRIEAINKQMALGNTSPGELLKSVIKLYSERVSAQGMAIELAIRQWARSDPDTKRLLIVVLTSSNLQEDVDKAYELGANSYLVKPVEFDEMVQLIRRFEVYWTEINRTPTSPALVKVLQQETSFG